MRKSELKNNRFINPWGNKKVSLCDLLKWQLFEKKNSWIKSIAINQSNELINPKTGEIGITFINHATFLLQTGNINILIDPIWSDRAGPIIGPKRIHSPGIAFDKLPKIDYVLISHAHYDHLDIKTLCCLIDRYNPLIVTGLKTEKIIFKKRPLAKIISLDWYENIKHSDIDITFVPSNHWSNRTLFDINKYLWGGFLINIENKLLYFAGDTGYANGAVFSEIKEFVKNKTIDFSFLPIGAYLPRWFMKNAHINPEEAVLGHKILQSKMSCAFHFGTFRLSNEGYLQPEKDLNSALIKHKITKKDFMIPKVGEQFFI